MNFLDLIFSKFYKYNSGHNDSGTLLNLRTLLGRKNVTSDPIHNFTACNSFLEDVLDGHILAIAMHHFGMTDSDQVGVVDKVPEDERKEWFLEAVSKMVDAFVCTRLKADLGKLISGVQQVINGTYSSSGRTARQPRQQVLVNPDVDVHVEPLTSVHPSSSQTLEAAAHQEYSVIDHACSEVDTSIPVETDSSMSVDEDGVFNYAVNLITQWP